MIIKLPKNLFRKSPAQTRADRTTDEISLSLPDFGNALFAAGFTL